MGHAIFANHDDEKPNGSMYVPERVGEREADKLRRKRYLMVKTQEARHGSVTDEGVELLSLFSKGEIQGHLEPIVQQPLEMAWAFRRLLLVDSAREEICPTLVVLYPAGAK
jgi:hypothetical protein